MDIPASYEMEITYTENGDVNKPDGEGWRLVGMTALHESGGLEPGAPFQGYVALLWVREPPTEPPGPPPVPSDGAT